MAVVREQPIRAAEVVGALSLATDLRTGQPLEHALRTAVLAVQLGELAGASAQELVDAYYVALLHSSGCTSDGHGPCNVRGRHRAARRVRARRLRQSRGGRRVPPVERRTRPHAGAACVMVEQAIAHGLPAARQTLARYREVAQRFAGWLGFSLGTQAALEHVFERCTAWDFRVSRAATRSLADAACARGHAISPSFCPPLDPGRPRGR